MNCHGDQFVSWIKFYTNTYRLGVWIHAASEYTNENGNRVRASNGNCCCCNNDFNIAENGNEIQNVIKETDSHVLLCQFQQVERNNQRCKLDGLILSDEGKLFIRTCFEDNNLKDLIFGSIDQLIDKGLIELEDNKKCRLFDELAKQFIHLIRVKRSRFMKLLALDRRSDIAEDQIEHQRRVVLLGFKTEY